MKLPDTAFLQSLLTGFDYAEIRMNITDSTLISMSGKDIENVASGISTGGSVRGYRNGRWYLAAFTDPEGARDAISKAKEIEQVIPAGAEQRLPNRAPVHIEKTTPVGIPLNSVPFDAKLELLRGYNELLRAPEKIQTSRALYRDSVTEYININTDGSVFLYNKSHAGIALTAIGRDGTDIQPYHQSVAGYGGFETVTGQEILAEHVAGIATDLLSAGTIDGGRYQLITDQRLTGVFIHEAFGHLSEADAVYENTALKRIMTLGKTFGPDFLNVLDDGTIEQATGYIPCDDECTPARRNYLIKEGRLAGRLHSRETAMRMNEEPTGNARAITTTVQPLVRMTNTFIDNGPHTTDELFAAVDDGIYAVDYHGGMTNLEMFTFSPAYGYEIKNGKKGRMIRNIMFSGNVFETIGNIAMIGNDLKLYGGLGGCGKGGQSPLPVSLGGPHMLIRNVLVGGNQ